MPKGRNKVRRRVYKVPWANSLWHINGHMKLNPYGIVIHGGVDGHLHMVGFMVAADNNRASTVLGAFEGAVAIYGLPSRVRSDRGKENWEVKRVMEETRGLGRGSFIVGTSTHNQRIERMWVNLQDWCTAKYMDVLREMVEDRVLDLDNSLHLWCLHFCFIPQLNLSLEWFIKRWNTHHMSTEGGRRPVLVFERSEFLNQTQ